MKKNKAYLNVLKMRLNVRLKREVVHNYPVAAFIEPTSFCNLHCPACPTGLGLGLRPTTSIDEQLFRSAIDEIGDYIFQLYMYNWGEPLLHKRTPEMIAYAKAKEIKIVLSTNLSIKLTDDYTERLVRSGLDTIIVSIDGLTQETYARYRRNGNLDLVRANMLAIKRMKEKLGLQTPNIVWQFLAFKHNEHELDEARAVYREWGADELSVGPAIMPLDPYNDGLEPSTITQLNLYHPDNRVQKEAARQMASGRSCTWLYGVFVLNPNGKVSPCCAVPSEKLDFGEYAVRDDFHGLWNNDKFRQARRAFIEWGKKPAKAMSAKQQAASSHLVDGMGAHAAPAKESELICHKCPIPHLQDYVDPVIVGVTQMLASSFAGKSSLRDKVRCSVNYLLMGAPNWREMSRHGVRYASKRLRLSSS